MSNRPDAIVTIKRQLYHATVDQVTYLRGVIRAMMYHPSNLFLCLSCLIKLRQVTFLRVHLIFCFDVK